MGGIAVRNPGNDTLLVVRIRDVTEMEKVGGYVTLLLCGKSGDALLDFFNTHGRTIVKTLLFGKRVG